MIINQIMFSECSAGILHNFFSFLLARMESVYLVWRDECNSIWEEWIGGVGGMVSGILDRYL